MDLDGGSPVAGQLEVKRLGVHIANTGSTIRSSASCSVLVGVASDQAEIGKGEIRG